MNKIDLSESYLDYLEELSKLGDPNPWLPLVEGRDFLSGDSFIQVGVGAERKEDIYVSRDSGPADSTAIDLIAISRTVLPVLISEIRKLRRSIEEIK